LGANGEAIGRVSNTETLEAKTDSARLRVIGLTALLSGKDETLGNL